MTGKAGLKAGLIGAAIMLILSLIDHLLPIEENTVLALAMCGVSTIFYTGIGVLAGLFLALPSPRTPGRGAGAGAVAGVISGVTVGAVGYVMVATGISSTLNSPQMQQMIEQGFDPTIISVLDAVCNPILGAGLAAIGGAVLAAIKPD